MTRGSRIDLLRVVFVVGLLVLAGLALAVREGRSISGAPEGRSSLAVLGFLGLLTGCWVVTYLLVGRALQPSRWARPLGALVATAAFGVTALLVMANAGEPQPDQPGCHYTDGELNCLPENTEMPLPTATPTLDVDSSREPFTLPVGPLVAVVAALLVAVATVVILGRRRPSPPEEEPDGLTPAALRSAVEAAGYALRLGSGPRNSVIACYVTMERALAGAGAMPRPSDTPAEVLSRAADNGLIRGSAAEELTELFRAARFSRRPITDEHVRRAAEALTAVREDLAAVEEGA